MSHHLHAANRQQCPLPTNRHLVYRLHNGIFTRSVYQCQIQCQLIAYKCFYYMNTFVLSHRSNEIESLVLNVLTNVDGVYLAMKKQVTHSKTTKSAHCFFYLIHCRQNVLMCWCVLCKFHILRQWLYLRCQYKATVYTIPMECLQIGKSWILDTAKLQMTRMWNVSKHKPF